MKEFGFERAVSTRSGPLALMAIDQHTSIIPLVLKGRGGSGT